MRERQRKGDSRPAARPARADRTTRRPALARCASSACVEQLAAIGDRLVHQAARRVQHLRRLQSAQEPQHFARRPDFVKALVFVKRVIERKLLQLLVDFAWQAHVTQERLGRQRPAARHIQHGFGQVQMTDVHVRRPGRPGTTCRTTTQNQSAAGARPPACRGRGRHTGDTDPRTNAASRHFAASSRRIPRSDDAGKESWRANSRSGWPSNCT